MNIALPSFNIQLIIEIALFASKLGGKRTVGMVVENVFSGVVAKGLVEATDHVLRRRFEE